MNLPGREGSNRGNRIYATRSLLTANRQRPRHRPSRTDFWIVKLYAADTLAATVLCCLITFAAAPVQSIDIPNGEDRQKSKVIAGWTEIVQLPGQDFAVKAKLDTGARTSSIYAVDIEPLARDDQPWVRFTLVLKDTEGDVHRLTLERPLIREVRIRTHDGDEDDRAVVSLNLCFNGAVYETEFSLKRRSGFNYPVLLGRRFLKQVALVDSDHTFLTRRGCGE